MNIEMSEDQCLTFKNAVERARFLLKSLEFSPERQLYLDGLQCFSIGLYGFIIGNML
ncbi:MAG: hypothetical protein Q8M03_09090 [Legionella sp.]|nr:hypothetical protein [Legionella sp.]